MSPRPREGKPAMATVMLIQTREGPHPVRTQNAACKTAAEVVAHCKRNSATMGFTVQFAVNPERGEVIEVIRKGKLVQRDVKALVEAGFSEWLYSWAFAGKTFRLPDGREVPITHKLDLIKTAEVLPWARAFGYL